MSPRPPVNPYVVLAVAILLPGGGHVLAGQPARGFGFAFFSLLLALLTWHMTTADQSFAGRSAGGLFVWALSIPDAYRIARLNYERWRMGAKTNSPAPAA